eukprot:789136-Amphidinium_carterae.1
MLAESWGEQQLDPLAHNCCSTARSGFRFRPVATPFHSLQDDSSLLNHSCDVMLNLDLGTSQCLAARWWLWKSILQYASATLCRWLAMHLVVSSSNAWLDAT